MKNSTITLGITGASGLQYGMRLLQCLLSANKKVYLTLSTAAHVVAVHELDVTLPRQTPKLQQYLIDHFKAAQDQLVVFDEHQWTAPIASGSSITEQMVICPCSSNTLAAIANGLSTNLTERAADVILKERKKLILVTRETPLSAIHVENMAKLLRLNAVVLPASPGFYNKPQSVNDMVDFIVARILDQLEVSHDLIKRWGIDL